MLQPPCAVHIKYQSFPPLLQIISQCGHGAFRKPLKQGLYLLLVLLCKIWILLWYIPSTDLLLSHKLSLWKSQTETNRFGRDWNSPSPMNTVLSTSFPSLHHSVAECKYQRDGLWSCTLWGISTCFLSFVTVFYLSNHNKCFSLLLIFLKTEVIHIECYFCPLWRVLGVADLTTVGSSSIL